MILDMETIATGDMVFSDNPDYKEEGFIHEMSCSAGGVNYDHLNLGILKTYDYMFRSCFWPEYIMEVQYKNSLDGWNPLIHMVKIRDYQVRTLSPVMSQYDQNMYRVIFKQLDKGYEVHVGDDFIRTFPSYKNLPKEVKEKLGIVYSKFPSAQDDDKLRRMSISAYLNADIEMQAIGWRVSKSWTCLVLTEKTLNSLRGEKLNDTGGEGKSEG